MRLQFLIIALLGVLVTCEAEYDEPSLCVEEKDLFAYRHCIKKRDSGCNSGGLCGTCNNNACQTCQGTSCRTSCSGESCTQCPNGNCCDGQNCNVCSGNKCCNSSNCNSCANQCNVGCSSWACQTACVQACQAPCGCNLNQNNCFGTCREQCVGDHCYEHCFKQCPCDKNCIAPTGPTGPTVNPTEPLIPQNGNHTITIVNKPENSNPVNISTVVNLKNYIYNKNVIHNPINVTNVNHNHVQASNQTTSEKNESTQKNCCYVIHPIHCFDIAEPPYKRCIRKRHWECSDICTSIVVHLVHTKESATNIVNKPVYVPVIWPPPQQPIQRPTGHLCGYINTPPYIRCGSYGLQNCGSCYVCSGQYNPGSCSLLSNCPNLCRGGILPNDPWLRGTLSQYASYYQNVPAGYAFAPPVHQLQTDQQTPQQEQQVLHVAGQQQAYQLQSLPLQYEQQQEVSNQQQ